MLTIRAASKKNSRTLLAFRVSSALPGRIKYAARRQGITVQAFCEEAIEIHLARAEKKNGNGDTARTVIEKLRKSSSTE